MAKPTLTVGRWGAAASGLGASLSARAAETVQGAAHALTPLWWWGGALAVAGGAAAGWWGRRNQGPGAAKLKEVLEFADCLLWEAKVRRKGQQLDWSEFSLQQTGLSRRLFEGRIDPRIAGIWGQFEVPERDEMDARCRAALANGQPGYEQQFRIVEPGGKTRWLRESVSITRVGTELYRLVGLVTDITAQRHADHARRASEERLLQLLARADCMLWQAQVTLGEDGKFAWEWFIPRSELYRRIAGDDTTQQRMPWDTSLVPEFAEIEQRSRRAMLEGMPGYEQEFRVVLGGAVIWLHEQVAVEKVKEREWRLDGVVINITAQREAETSKQATEAQLRRVVENADFLLWHARVFQAPDGGLHWILHAPNSQLYRRLVGKDSKGDIALPWREIVDEVTYQEMVDRAHGAILRGDPGYEQEIAGRLNDRVFWLNEQATIQRVAPGEWQLVGIVTDVTVRHQAEQARQASERALREILERANCLLWRATVVRAPEGRLRWVHFDLPASRLCNELLGGRRPTGSTQLWDLADVPELAEMNARSTEAILGGATAYEQEFRAKQGERAFWLHEQVTILPIARDEWRLVGVITDVTQRHEAEEAQRRSEARLEELLRRADCLIWQGYVTKQPDSEFHWKLYVPRSRLHRRVFGRDPDGHGFAWEQIGVPEASEMRRTARTALVSGAPGYEQVFHVPKPEGDIWISEQVTINPAGPGEWEVVGIITDITARREAEEARRATEAQLRQILELAECMVWEANVVRRDGRDDWRFYTTRSAMHRRLFGEDMALDGGFDWSRLNVPELPEMHARSAEALRTGASGYEQEFRVLHAQQVVWLHEVVTIASLGGGQYRLVGVVTDITAQREAQEALRASQAQVEQMLATAVCLLWQARVFEVAPRRLRWVMFVPRSRLHRELFGHEPANPATLEWEKLTDEATNAEINNRAINAILSGAPGYEQEFRAQRGDRVFWLHEQVSIKPVGPGEWQLVGVMTDLTERRAAEQAVRASELRYRTLYQHTPVAILEADFSEVGRWLDGLRAQGVTDLGEWLTKSPRQVVHAASLVRFVDCNDSAVTIFRAAKKSDFRRRRAVLSTADSLRVIRSAMLCLWEGRNTLETEIEMLDFESRLHHMHVRWWMERGDGGLDLRQAVMVFVDLTELKQAEAALAAEKERLAVTLRAMAEGVITTDVEGRVQYLNPAAAAFTCCEPEAAIGRPVSEVCRFENERTGERVEVPVRRVAQGDVVLQLPTRTKLTVENGPSRLVEGCCAPIHSAESTVIGTVLVFRDVTEHERLEQELVRATKLESVGILAGGIAHDFNNILTAVMGNVALAALEVDPASDAARSLHEAEKATLRARDLTQQLLTFAKGGEPVRAAVQLDAIVREMTTFTLHGSRVRAVYDFAGDLWPADADKGQIGRVVQNLVLNAVQAMPEGGTVKISLRNERIDGLSRLALAPGDYVQIAISDTGVGIKPEHLSRIFDPYFTTKQMGSGLGLAAVYSIVNKHRGTIDVESHLGSGTTFRIWLPASQRPAEDGSGERTLSRAVSLKGRLLFMDDEESIRQMASMLLRRFGFEVVCAPDGAEAVRLYRQAHEDGEPFALVMMDLTVPGGMGGREAIAQVRQINPHVRAIVSSGYSSDPVLANFREHGFCGVAAKPYEVGDLARVLREALAGASELETAGDH
ncbi:MAG TPA: PAS domain S-box protein [Opitutus sp.]|nr:PAS domain S-box protein [Opitutus sp.]